MSCYRKGDCGPYEMYSCLECPASKPEYANRYINQKAAADVTKIIKRLREIRNSIDWDNAILNGYTSEATSYMTLLEVIAGKRYMYDLANIVFNDW